MSAYSARRLGLTSWIDAGRHARGAHRVRVRRLTVLLLTAAAVVPLDTIAGAVAPVVTATAAVGAGVALVVAWRWRRRSRQLEQILCEELDHHDIT
ncbi:hypothetical protein [Amycolatopsis sp. Hca4]|uniref:hypothetical protein n=1 Tax=Amycolatopsis sp. Hca4 TaxID=2742131 RepID=UPI0015905A0F|nr:hypothetical protein [Amycolatopsis sp. Hca4]QKV73903.1 hypothetical protein HUT10_09065 [Amycolatopsis sp. Hca4]